MHNLPKLNYSYGALEPHIDATTMEIHHLKHHQGYVDKLNAVLEKHPHMKDKNLEDLLKDVGNLAMEDADKTALINNSGGHLNHSLFWEVMGPEKEVDEQLVEELKKEFGSIDEFKNVFGEAAKKHFGSGWAWLVRDEEQKLKVYSLPNQNSPYCLGHLPIFNLDVWEHAYYLKYQNKRAQYVDAWWNALKLI